VGFTVKRSLLSLMGASALGLTIFLSAGILKAGDVWPWPLSVTCPVQAKQLDGWWQSENSPTRYFRFTALMPIDGKFLVEFNQFTAAGTLVTHGHAVAANGAKSMTFEVFERTAPRHKRVVYVHQLDMEKASCASAGRTTVVSYVKPGTASVQAEAEAIYNVVPVEAPNFVKKLKP
jgi:hypothetical protein